MASDAPIQLGPFAVDKAGRLTFRTPQTPSSFYFQWRGRSTGVHLSPTDGADGTLRLQVRLGRVLSTAADRGDGSRARGFGLLRILQHGLPAGWRVQLRADHQVILVVDDRLTVPFTATGLLVRITSLILALAPYFELLDEVGGLARCEVEAAATSA
jgi:hypothetical protein